MSVETGGTLADSVDSAKMLVEAGGDAGRVDDDRWMSVKMLTESVEIGGCR